MSGDALAGAHALMSFRDNCRGETWRETRRENNHERSPSEGVSVLLIDGTDAETQEIMASLAECQNPKFTVRHVSDPKEAQHVWREHKHDLVIIDVWLGRGVSVELVSLLTNSPCSCPVVMLSSLSSEELQAFFTDANLFIHSKKNITPSALARTLETALSGSDDAL